MRVQRAHDALELDGRTRGIEQAIARLDLLGIRDAGLVLLDELEAAPGGELVERAEQQLAAECREPRGERSIAVASADRLAGAQTDRTAVESCREAHDRDARALVAGDDRALDRRRAAPAGQQRRVHVEQRVRREQRLPDQRTERAHDDGIGFQVGDLRRRRLVVDVLGLLQHEPERAGALGDGRRGQAPPAPARAIRPGQDQRRAVLGALGESLEDRGGELRRTEIDDAQGTSALVRRLRPSRAPRASRASPPCVPGARCGRGSGCRRGGRPRAGSRAP